MSYISGFCESHYLCFPCISGRAVDVKDNRGWMPLHEAAYHGNTECLALLLKLEGRNQLLIQ